MEPCAKCFLLRCKCKNHVKRCENCNKPFTVTNRGALNSRKYCSHPCAVVKQIKPDSEKVFRTCCVCKGPTKYIQFKRGANKNKVLVHCGQTDCKEAVRKKKNFRISQARKREWRSGKRTAPPNPWAKASRVSKEEVLMKDWFVAQGWEPQYHVNTGIRKSPKIAPYCFDLDFAHVNNKIYVEIDGSVHRTKHKKELDERRTNILQNLGWRGLRIPATKIISIRKRVLVDIESVKKEILRFQETQAE